MFHKQSGMKFNSKTQTFINIMLVVQRRLFCWVLLNFGAPVFKNSRVKLSISIV